MLVTVKDARQASSIRTGVVSRYCFAGSSLQWITIHVTDVQKPTSKKIMLKII